MLEDLHWADEATLDVLRMLARRVHAFRALIIGTYRDDELGRDSPLRLVLGELPAVERIRLEPFSVAAVGQLAGTPSDQLHARTGGNPFFVTELLAAGVLQSGGNAVQFRHELARSTIEESLPPDRYVQRHRAALHALAGRADPARLAHHAGAAGDPAATLEYATAAASRATALSAHREAARYLDQALRHAGTLGPEARTDLLDRAAVACYVTGRFDDASLHGRAAVEAARLVGDRLREGVLLLALSRYDWYRGEAEHSQALNRQALEVLGGFHQDPSSLAATHA